MAKKSNGRQAADARTWIGTLALLAGLALGSAGVRGGDTSASSKEYEIKAAFLLNFLQYIQWPAGSFAAADSPITVGVLGDDPFGTILEQTFRDERAGGRKLAIVRSKKVEDLKGCNLVFVCKSEKDGTAAVLAALKDNRIVTVGETDHFVQKGGLINFYLDNNKVRFEIDPGLAEKKGLKVSAQLLKRAKIVSANAG